MEVVKGGLRVALLLPRSPPQREELWPASTSLPFERNQRPGASPGRLKEQTAWETTPGTAPVTGCWHDGVGRGRYGWLTFRQRGRRSTLPRRLFIVIFCTCAMLMLCCVVFVIFVLWQSGQLTCTKGQCYEARSPHDQARWGGRWWCWGGGWAALQTDGILLSSQPGGGSDRSTPPDYHWIYFTTTTPVWGPERALPLRENTSSVSVSGQGLWWCVTSSLVSGKCHCAAVLEWQ